jgi:hypothetical protein
MNIAFLSTLIFTANSGVIKRKELLNKNKEETFSSTEEGTTVL